jgi:hypothetical protein
MTASRGNGSIIKKYYMVSALLPIERFMIHNMSNIQNINELISKKKIGRKAVYRVAI